MRPTERRPHPGRLYPAPRSLVLASGHRPSRWSASACLRRARAAAIRGAGSDAVSAARSRSSARASGSRFWPFGAQSGAQSFAAGCERPDESASAGGPSRLPKPEAAGSSPAGDTTSRARRGGDGGSSTGSTRVTGVRTRFGSGGLPGRHRARRRTARTGAGASRPCSAQVLGADLDPPTEAEVPKWLRVRRKGSSADPPG